MILNRRSPDVFADVSLVLSTAQPAFRSQYLGAIPQNGTVELGIKLFEEEGIKEYLGALRKYQENPTRENMVAVFDGGLDTIVVVSWLMEAMMLPCQAGWNEVQRANMSKFPFVKDWPVPPKPMDLPEYKDIDIEYHMVGGRWILRNAKTGKFLKPECYVEPDLHKVIMEMEAINIVLTQRGGQIANEFLKDYFVTQETKRLEGKVADV